MWATEPRRENQHSTTASDWHLLNEAEVLGRVGSRRSGLLSAEAAENLHAYGPNTLREGKPIRPWLIFAQQFKSLLIFSSARAFLRGTTAASTLRG